MTEIKNNENHMLNEEEMASASGGETELKKRIIHFKCPKCGRKRNVDSGSRIPMCGSCRTAMVRILHP